MLDRLPDFANWIGRTETRSDLLTSSPLERLMATLDREAPTSKLGSPIPPLAHWLYFLPSDRQSELGPDGHPRRGGFLPPIHDLPRRMWAGSRLTFLSDLRIGMNVIRRSTITSIKEKQGSAGPLVFVTVRHEIGEADAETFLIEEHDIVYRGLAATMKPTRKLDDKGTWTRSLVPDDVTLFRYSALTFNGHRIHFDRDYVTKQEGYPGLVVHGPFLATLLIDLIDRNMPGAQIGTFEFQAISPLFDRHKLMLHGTPLDDGRKIKLWVVGEDRTLAMNAEATIRNHNQRW